MDAIKRYHKLVMLGMMSGAQPINKVPEALLARPLWSNLRVPSAQHVLSIAEIASAGAGAGAPHEIYGGRAREDAHGGAQSRVLVF